MVFVLLQSCMGSVVTIGGGIVGGGGAAESAETIYMRFETDLQISIDNMETSYPGYDEYRRNIGPIGHNPYELMGFLAVCNSFAEDEMESVLRGVFDSQYTLATTEITESRETENEDGETVTEEVRIFDITLTVIPFADAIAPHLTAAQLERYNQYNYSQ